METGDDNIHDRGSDQRGEVQIRALLAWDGRGFVKPASAVAGTLLPLRGEEIYIPEFGQACRVAWEVFTKGGDF